MKAIRIESGMYRIGDFTAYRTSDNKWRMGILLFNEDFMAGFAFGTVTNHTTLNSCKRFAAVAAKVRSIRPNLPIEKMS